MGWSISSIFHKLQNVKRDMVGQEGMNVKEKRERREDVLSDATRVYRGKDEREIRQRLADFRDKWQHEEPKAVPPWSGTLTRPWST